MDEDSFFSTTLGEWIRDCFCSTSQDLGDSKDDETLPIKLDYNNTITYERLCDGIALNRLFSFINPSGYENSCDIFKVDGLASEELSTFTNWPNISTNLKTLRIYTPSLNSHGICNTASILLNRLRYFHLLKRRLEKYYWSNSMYLILFPDIIEIARNPCSDVSGGAMLGLLGLMLGAAVQSERRELFIERIKAMRPQTQHQLIAEIQRVTSDNDCMMSLETLQQLAQQQIQQLQNDANNEIGCSEEDTVATAEENNSNEGGAQRIFASLIDCMMKERGDYASALLDIAVGAATPALGTITDGKTTVETEDGPVQSASGGMDPSSSGNSQNGDYSPSSSCCTATSGVGTSISDGGLGVGYDNVGAAPLTAMKYMCTGASSIASCGSVSHDMQVSTVMATGGVGSEARGAATVSAMEYVALKAEVRKLRNENEERDELITDLQDELEQRDAQLSRLQAERLELVKDARAAKDYRDQIDCMQHKMLKLERLEAENEKLKTKMSEVNFYKTRMNSLKEDNEIVQETCRVLEEQLEQCQRKLANYLEIEGRMIEAQANVKSLQLDLTKSREQMEDLLVENGRLERESKEHSQKWLELQRRMDHMSGSSDSPRDAADGAAATAAAGVGRGSVSLNDSSLLAQLDACNQTQILELQLENRKLKSQLENAANSANPAELFEIRAELTEAKKLAEMSQAKATNLSGKLDAERRTVADAQQRIAETEIALADARRVANSAAQQQIDALKTKLANLEHDLATVANERQAIRDEKLQVEKQLERMCAQQREARAEIDTLAERLAGVERERDALERSRRSLEAERGALKLRVDAADERVNQLERHIGDAECARQRAAQLDEQLRERVGEIAALHATSQTLRHELEDSTLAQARLRDELGEERTRGAELVARMRAVCASIANDGGGNEMASAQLSDAQLVATIDEMLVRAFNATRREADALRIQQRAQIRELDDLKRDIEALRKTERELPNTVGDKYGEMLVENRNIKEQVGILQERLRRAQIDEATRSAELQAARREIDELQQKIFAQNRQNAELPQLRATLRECEIRAETAQRDYADARLRLDALKEERDDALRASRKLSAVNDALARDHDRLQELHQTLVADYERAKRDAGVLKQRVKAEKSTLENALRAEFNRERVALEERLAVESAERQRFFQKLVDCETELTAAQKELRESKGNSPSSGYYGTPPPSLNSASAANSATAGDAHNELRRLRLLECAQKSTINNLNMTIQQLNNLLTEKDLEIANLRRQIDMLRQYNGEESRSLIRQIELLLIQNQQLHNRSDVFYAEQKELQEKLAQLRRHKEKLEEKIMDQYKAIDSRKIDAKPTLVRRAAKALISKSPGRKLTRHEGSSSITTEDSSVYSADEALFATATCHSNAKSQNGNGNSANIVNNNPSVNTVSNRSAAITVANKLPPQSPSNNGYSTIIGAGHRAVTSSLANVNTVLMPHAHANKLSSGTVIVARPADKHENKDAEEPEEKRELVGLYRDAALQIHSAINSTPYGRRATSLTPNPPRVRPRLRTPEYDYCDEAIARLTEELENTVRNGLLATRHESEAVADTTNKGSADVLAEVYRESGTPRESLELGGKSNAGKRRSGEFESPMAFRELSRRSETFVEKSRGLLGGSARSAGSQGSAPVKSRPSLLLQRFFSRSSPFRRSTATCSSYMTGSAASASSSSYCTYSTRQSFFCPSPTASSSSGCSVMSSVSSDCSTRIISPLSGADEAHGTLMIVPLKERTKMSRASSLCFRLASASNGIRSRSSGGKRAQNAARTDSIGDQRKMIDPRRAKKEQMCFKDHYHTLKKQKCRDSNSKSHHDHDTREELEELADLRRIFQADQRDAAIFDPVCQVPCKTHAKRLSAYDNGVQ